MTATTATADKLVIVNADDLGYSAGVNRGILASHERGIVTSASVMVRWPAADEVRTIAKSHPRLSLGLHVDLGEWACRDGSWAPLYSVLPDDQVHAANAVAAEIDRQLDAFRRIVGREPTHLDSHQHVHRDEPLRSVLVALAERLGVPLRHHDARVRYCGQFFGQQRDARPYPQGISVERLIDVLGGIAVGVTELACHPGTGVDHASQYAQEREQEVAALCDPRVQAAAAAAGVRFISFAELPPS